LHTFSNNLKGKDFTPKFQNSIFLVSRSVTKSSHTTIYFLLSMPDKPFTPSALCAAASQRGQTRSAATARAAASQRGETREAARVQLPPQAGGTAAAA
jgi:hypothetical protein